MAITQTARRVFMLLSPRSLSYAHHALDSLLQRSVEQLDLTLITDGEEDKAELLREVDALPVGEHRVRVLAQADLDLLEHRFANFPGLLKLRRGNPCWRKITDPLLLSEGDEEMIVLDPDLFFPNQFAFEATPTTGVVLMWQTPNCMLPHEVVRDLLQQGVALSQHVDIGVAQLRFSSIDLAWLDGVVQGIDLQKHRKWMHLEAILWSAMLSKFGGGHLDPEIWICWRRTQRKRVRIKLRTDEVRMMREEDLSQAKCFHAGGGAKNWIAPARAAGILDLGRTRTEPSQQRGTTPYTARDLQHEVNFKRWLRRLGYYAIFSGS